ncbi:PGAM [Musa troglodytarum]|uniref:PGAM n=1 Tax=Musa troglodytarum TaxID=320322 RepID=A0A9E7KU45_9LILI|nr:PGAM [Musa troglodytarum]
MNYQDRNILHFCTASDCSSPSNNISDTSALPVWQSKCGSSSTPETDELGFMGKLKHPRMVKEETFCLKSIFMDGNLSATSGCDSLQNKDYVKL